MKTGNFLSAGMLVLVVGLTSDLSAQGRGRDDHRGNGNQGKAQVSEHPGRGIPGENHGRDRSNENPNRGHDRDFQADLRHDNKDRGNDRDHQSDQRWNQDRGNDHDRYDRDRQVDHNRNYGDDNRNRDDHNQRDHRTNTYRYDDRTGHHNRYVTYNYNRHGRPQWAPYYGYRYNTRYIYYQDYNVYYDCHRNVFIVWTGRNWVVTTRIPDYMYRIDFNRASVRGVEYWDDDFDFYLQRRRPAYVNLQVGW